MVLCCLALWRAAAAVANSADVVLLADWCGAKVSDGADDASSWSCLGS